MHKLRGKKLSSLENHKLRIQALFTQEARPSLAQAICASSDEYMTSVLNALWAILMAPRLFTVLGSEMEGIFAAIHEF